MMYKVTVVGFVLKVTYNLSIRTNDIQTELIKTTFINLWIVVTRVHYINLYNEWKSMKTM
jgi:starvation-inducible outer membrane lipoprotein